MNEAQNNIVSISATVSLLAGFILASMISGTSFNLGAMLVITLLINTWWTIGYWLHINKSESDKNIASNTWLWPYMLMTQAVGKNPDKNPPRPRQTENTAGCLYDTDRQKSRRE